MHKYHVKLLKREEVAKSTMAFYFEKPQGFEFKPGQFIEVILKNLPEEDPQGNERHFSLVSAPNEDTLQIATRMRGTPFKRTLRDMPLQKEVLLEGPFGSLLLHNDASRPAVFLAGGIGITPFMSMLRTQPSWGTAREKKLAHRIYLFHSNRTRQDAPFFDELQELTNCNPNFTFIPTMTEADTSWKGEGGYINKEMLLRHIPDLYAPIYYVVGPPTFALAMRKMLNDAGVDDDNIRSEEFSGY